LFQGLINEQLQNDQTGEIKMNIKLLIALSFSLLIVACAGSSNNAQTTNNATIKGCFINTKLKCDKEKNGTNTAKISANAANPKANPPTICTMPGNTINIEVVQPGGPPITVIAVPKNSKDGWILATNVLDPTKMTITVPKRAPNDTYFEYMIITSKGNCADPRIRIGPN